MQLTTFVRWLGFGTGPKGCPHCPHSLGGLLVITSHQSPVPVFGDSLPVSLFSGLFEFVAVRRHSVLQPCWWEMNALDLLVGQSSDRQSLCFADEYI